MANFVPQLIGTTEALSPTISGLTSAVSKLAKALNLQTSTITDFVMTEVYISETDRCRIYEVGLDKKGWLESPTAVIKKNGVALNSSVDNFVVDYIGGSIEFKGNKPTPTDVLTVTATYINEFSTVLQNLSASQTELLQKVSVFKGNFDTLNQLQTDISNPQKGDYAIVLGTDNNIYVWNDTTTSWQGVFKPTDLSNFYNKTEIDNKLALKEPTINKKGETASSDNYYYSGRKTWIDFFGKVKSTVLTGLSKTDKTEISAADNVLSSIGKLQGQLNDTYRKADVYSKSETYSKEEANSVFSNPNLLINGDFKVNQRGKTSYENSKTYSVDRWSLYGKLNVTNNGVNLSIPTGYPYAEFSQTFENEFTIGTKLTLSAKVNGIIYNGSLIVSDNQLEGNAIYFDGCSSSQFYTRLINKKTVDFVLTSSTANIEWIKLELGSVATLFAPRNYGEELAICKRYFEPIAKYCFPVYVNAIGAIDFEPKRIVPTVKINGIRRIDSTAEITEATVRYLNNEQINSIILPENTVNMAYIVSLELDAEIY